MDGKTEKQGVLRFLHSQASGYLGMEVTGH